MKTLSDLKNIDETWNYGFPYPLARPVLKEAIKIIESAEISGYSWNIQAINGVCTITLKSVGLEREIIIRPTYYVFEENNSIYLNSSQLEGLNKLALPASNEA